MQGKRSSYKWSRGFGQGGNDWGTTDGHVKYLELNFGRNKLRCTMHSEETDDHSSQFMVHTIFLLGVLLEAYRSMTVK